MDHPGVAILAKFVALIGRGEASAEQRRAAVLLAMHLFQLDEISKGKCVKVARDAGPTEPALDDAIRVLQEDLSGNVPPEWASLPLPLTDEAIARMEARISQMERVVAAAERLMDAHAETFRKLSE